MGYTSPHFLSSRSNAVHPHSRGVYPARRQPTLSALRFIPTRVGYTSASSVMSWPGCGSSPLAWGILCSRLSAGVSAPVHPHSRGVYFNPASWSWAASSVHPHSRGVYGTTVRTLVCSTVHPHSRGVYYSPLFISRYIVRFIPTRVGYTSRPLHSCLSTPGSSPLAWGILLGVFLNDFL